MSDFSTYLVEPSVLQLSDQVNYPVVKAQANTAFGLFQPNGAPSSTTQSYNLVVPSLENVCDRLILWKSQIKVNFSSNGANLPVGQYLLNLNGLDAFAPFPAQQAITILTCQINSTQVSLDYGAMFPQLLHLVSKEDLLYWNNMTPTMLDSYSRYEDACLLNNNNNPLAPFGFNTSFRFNNTRGSFVYDAVVNPIGTGAPIPAGGASITATFVEPLIMSPYLFSNDHASGLQGVNQINFTINTDSAGKRVFRSSTVNPDGTARAVVPTVTGIEYPNPSVNQMMINFLTPSPYQLAKYSPRCVVPYQQLIRYKTPITNALAVGASSTMTTNSIQLQCIPDKIIISISSETGTLTNVDADFFATITKVSLSFNAKQNLLSTATPYQLYKMSVQSGSQQSWFEFSGKVSAGNSVVANNQGQKVVGTCGSVLVLDFASVVDIPELYLAPSSAGSFNLSATIDYVNNTGRIITNATATLIVVTGGLFSTEKGSSQTFVNILNKDGVMSVLDDKPVDLGMARKKIGGSFLSTLTKIGKFALPIAKALSPMVKSHLASRGKYGKIASDVMGAVGLGSTGSGGTGAGRSAGRLSKHLM